MQEMWIKCLEFPDYSISSYGRVRNDIRRKIVQQSVTRQGALKVGLSVGGKQYTRSVKVLVAQHFVENVYNSEIFNTPIHLDGNQSNCHCDNLLWRPRWFAVKYTQQFSQIKWFSGIGPVVDTETGMLYENVVQACFANGFLFGDMLKSIVENERIFPTRQLFCYAREFENYQKSK